MLPFNYAIGAPSGSILIITTMQLQVKKYITLSQANDNLPSRAVVFFDLTNQFNSVSRQAFFNVIAMSFPEILPLATLFYEHAGTVHHKWADGTWHTLLMEEGVIQDCPFLPIFATLVVACLLKPLDQLLKACATHRLNNGNPGNDCAGGITHLLGYVDNVSTYNPHEDLEFICNHFNNLGKPLGCFVNPMKTRILTSTSGLSPINTLSQLEPILASSISNTIAKYSLQPNKSDPSAPPIPTKLTTGFRLLGSPVGLPTFARDFFNNQLSDVRNCITLLSTAITNPQT
jgi:hypothetical protein